jgi:hypothetical protein
MDEEVEMGEMLDGADNSCATAGGGDVASARERRTPAIASVTWTSVALLRRDPEIVRPLLQGGGRPRGQYRAHVLLLQCLGGL